jgi:hypothetical protein
MYLAAELRPAFARRSRRPRSGGRPTARNGSNAVASLAWLRQQARCTPHGHRGRLCSDASVTSPGVRYAITTPAIVATTPTSVAIRIDAAQGPLKTRGPPPLTRRQFARLGGHFRPALAGTDRSRNRPSRGAECLAERSMTELGGAQCRSMVPAGPSAAAAASRGTCSASRICDRLLRRLCDTTGSADGATTLRHPVA